MRFHHIAAAAIMLPAFFASVAPAVAGISVNGISINGLNFNGISVNGLTLNGLTLNGLTSNALAQNALGAGGATAFHGARVIAVEFAPIAR